MPSKRHGYLTRKEWLATRLAIQRDRASGADVDRFLRNIDRFLRKTFWGHVFDVEPRMRAWTNTLQADLERQGYAISCGEVTPEQIRARMSPPIQLWYNSNEPQAAKTPQQIYEDIEAMLRLPMGKFPTWPVGPDPLKNDPAEFARRWGDFEP